MDIVSAVTIAIKKGEKFLLIASLNGRGESFLWQFPHGRFKESINGNLNGTAMRVLENIVTSAKHSDLQIDYLGSYLHKKQDEIVIGYNFLIENFEGEVKAENFKWAERGEIEKGTDNIEIDQNTLIFLELNDELL